MLVLTINADRLLLMRNEVLLAGVGDVPNAARAIVGDEEAAIFSDSDADGAAPDLAVRGDEAGEEVFVAAFGSAVVHGDADDFVTGAVLAIPRAVFGCEGVAIVGGGELELVGGIEDHLQRGHVWLDEHVGSNHF